MALELRPRVRAALSLLSLTALASPAVAHTWWVDDHGGPGIDFTDIQPAIDAAAAGDTIFVYPGSYGGFTVDQSLTILSDTLLGLTHVHGAVDLQITLGSRRAVLSGLVIFGPVTARTTSQTIVFDNSTFSAPSWYADPALVDLDECTDVRFYDCSVSTTQISQMGGAVGIRAADSRVEVVRSLLVGGAGVDTGCNSDAGHGGTGIELTSGSRGIFHLSSSLAGDGGDTESFCEWNDVYGGDGGDGIRVDESSFVWIAGRSGDQLVGGREGYGDTFPFFMDGLPGYGVRSALSGGVRHSGASLQTMIPLVAPKWPADPFLNVLGTHQAGRQLTFRVFGPAGATARLVLGRDPEVTVVPGQDMEQLVSQHRLFTLGTIPASGQQDFVFTLPSWLPIGFSFFAQAEVEHAGGPIVKTNSVPIVVRHLP